jgi:hypothetical protein
MAKESNKRQRKTPDYQGLSNIMCINRASQKPRSFPNTENENARQ